MLFYGGAERTITDKQMHMNKFLNIFFAALIACTGGLAAQTTQSLVTHISFDKPNCQVADEAGDPAIQTYVDPNSNVVCDCGVEQNSMKFDGDGDYFFLFGSKVDNAFTTVDFTLSFYFLPTSTANESQALFSKRTNCTTDNLFSVRFNPATKLLNVELTESSTISGSIAKTLPSTTCWYHITVVRKGATTQLYLNGKEYGSANSPASLRVNVKNLEPLVVGSSNCDLDEEFAGYLDEIRLYNRAITREEVEDLYFFPDRIATGIVSTGTSDTTIFLGNSVQVELNNTCATDFAWSPANGVSDVGSPTPLLSPSQTTTYALKFETAAYGCVATDSLRITVIDPATLDCKDILLPSAFTPNGDGLNDTYGISNPFVAGEIKAFEIFDRWGNVVFRTTDPLTKWDGSHLGQPVNPGVFLYKIHFVCKDVEDVKSGSVTVIR